MKKIISILVFGMLLLSIVLVSANGGHESGIEEGKKLVESKISCDKLTDEQLESIGDYYMEQMHPGEAHELMHDMMGGHDSELTKGMHINMAKSIYCNENIKGMMEGSMMGGNMMQGMMTGGMMGNGYYQNPQNNGVYQNSFFGFQIFFYIILTLFIIVLILVIILLINKSKQTGRKTK